MNINKIGLLCLLTFFSCTKDVPNPEPSPLPSPSPTISVSPTPSPSTTPSPIKTPDKSYVISPEPKVFKIDGNKLNIEPGTHIVMKGGHYAAFVFENLKGTKDKPIFISPNKDATVLVDTSLVKDEKGRNYWVGIQFKNSKHVEISGLPGKLEIMGAFNSGLYLYQGTTNVFASHLEIHDIYQRFDPKCGGAGVRVHTKPDPEKYPADFKIRNIVLDNLLVYNTGSEGAYLGKGHTQTSNSYEILNLTVSNSHFHHTGWEGVQVRYADGVKVFNNKIEHNSLAPKVCDDWSHGGASIDVGEDVINYEAFNNEINNTRIGLRVGGARAMVEGSRLGKNIKIHHNKFTDTGVREGPNNSQTAVSIASGEVQIYDNEFIDPVNTFVRFLSFSKRPYQVVLKDNVIKNLQGEKYSLRKDPIAGSTFTESGNNFID